MIIALNNKSNLTKEEFLKYQEAIKKLSFKTTDVILIPSNIYLSIVSTPNISLGSQNVSMYEMGPHTGEVSAVQLKQLGVKYCLVGHSERRKEQHETNAEINGKIKSLLNQDIIPILCIGETKEEKNAAHTVVYQELQAALSGVTEEELEKVIFAYEPIWSIGTGLIPTSSEIESIISIIKETYPNNRVLYGGSVTIDNIEKLTQEKTVDGYLLGGLSLQLDKVQELIDKIEK